MTDLQWTDEPPEDEGAYWVDDNGPKTPRIAKVRWDTSQQLYRVKDPIDEGAIERWLYEYEDAQWAGPIPEPEDSDNTEEGESSTEWWHDGITGRT